MVPNRLLILSLTVAILLFSGCTGKQKIENGNNKKMDASLRTALTESERTGSDEHLQVLIELTQPLDESMRTVFLDHNIQIESVVDHIITVHGTAIRITRGRRSTLCCIDVPEPDKKTTLM
jgi:hypothetical protein